MFGFLKDLFAPNSTGASVAVSEIDALVAESQELGRQVDELRERRRMIKERLDVLHAEKIAEDKE